jgi:hypothetical protein
LGTSERRRAMSAVFLALVCLIGPTSPGACRKPGVKPDDEPNSVLTAVLVPLFVPTELFPAPLRAYPGLRGGWS